jgi:hypothetical protein
MATMELSGESTSSESKSSSEEDDSSSSETESSGEDGSSNVSPKRDTSPGQSIFSGESKTPCPNWSRGNGFCKYGLNCRNSHDGPKGGGAQSNCLGQSNCLRAGQSNLSKPKNQMFLESSTTNRKTH